MSSFIMDAERRRGIASQFPQGPSTNDIVASEGKHPVFFPARRSAPHLPQLVVQRPRGSAGLGPYKGS